LVAGIKLYKVQGKADNSEDKKASKAIESEEHIENS